jgi:hypothetical protein
VLGCRPRCVPCGHQGCYLGSGLPCNRAGAVYPLVRASLLNLLTGPWQCLQKQQSLRASDYSSWVFDVWQALGRRHGAPPLPWCASQHQA